MYECMTFHFFPKVNVPLEPEAKVKKSLNMYKETMVA